MRGIRHVWVYKCVCNSNSQPPFHPIATTRTYSTTNSIEYRKVSMGRMLSESTPTLECLAGAKWAQTKIAEEKISYY